jgi:hypothetical protein
MRKRWEIGCGKSFTAEAQRSQRDAEGELVVIFNREWTLMFANEDLGFGNFNHGDTEDTEVLVWMFGD